MRATAEAGLGERELTLLAANRYALSDRLDARDALCAGRICVPRSRSGSNRCRDSAGILEKMFLASDPTARDAARAGAHGAHARSPQRIDGVWFDAQGKRALIVAQTRALGSDLDGQAAAMAALERDVRREPHRRLRRRMRVLEPRRDGGRRAAHLDRRRCANAVDCIHGGRARDPRVGLSLARGRGTVRGPRVVRVARGRGDRRCRRSASLHGIALAFGATLLGEAVDYPTLSPHAGARRRSPQQVKPRRASRHADRLAVLTTACGAFALLFSGFPGLAQLGMLTVAGVLVAGAGDAVGAAARGARGVAPRPPPRWTWLAQSAARARHSAWRWAVVVLVTAGALALAWQHPWWDDDLASMNPLACVGEGERRAAARGDGCARCALRACRRRRTSREDALQQRGGAAPGARACRRIAGARRLRPRQRSSCRARRTQARRRQALPDAERLRADLAARGDGTSFQAGRVRAVHRGRCARARSRRRSRLKRYKGSALGPQGRRSVAARTARSWHVVVPLAEVRDAAALARSVAARRAPRRPARRDHGDDGRLPRAGPRVLRRSVSLLMYAVLAVGLRSFGGAVKVLLPIVLAAVAAAAMLVAFWEPLTVFHYVALLLTVGIGVNYALLLASPVARRRSRRIVAHDRRGQRHRADHVRRARLRARAGAARDRPHGLRRRGREPRLRGAWWCSPHAESGA